MPRSTQLTHTNRCVTVTVCLSYEERESQYQNKSYRTSPTESHATDCPDLSRLSRHRLQERSSNNRRNPWWYCPSTMKRCWVARKLVDLRRHGHSNIVRAPSLLRLQRPVKMAAAMMTTVLSDRHHGIPRPGGTERRNELFARSG